MRLHHLAITGFGPFAASEQVDLDALGSTGLFLIHGPTGAGKSSILDAICFALYAAVPGARAGARASLRSDHAAEGVIPEVTLEFTAGGRRLRVCRSPEFSRPRKRGTGDTMDPAKVVLEERTQGGWSCLGTRHDEVALLLKDVLGMGLEQFIKVVLLPQGDFAAFLRASPEERRSVLAKLFDTQRFTDVEAWLVERRRQTAEALGTARSELSSSLVRVDDVMTRLEPGVDIVAPAWTDVPREDIGDVLVALVTAVDLRASAALAGVEVATAAAARTEAALHHGTTVTRHQTTAAEAQVRLAALDEQREVYEEAVHLVARAERSQAVSGFVAAVESANRIRQGAVAKIAGLREPLADIIGRRDGADDADVGSLAALIELVAGHNDSLQQVVAQASRAVQLAAQSAHHGEAAGLDDAASVACAHQRAEAETLWAAAEVARDAGRAAAAEIPGLEARHKSLTRTQWLLGEQDRSARDLEALQRQADSADRLMLDARGRLLDLRERRLAGMAAELADGLSAGGPCPVCGSCAHPMRATTTNPVRPADIRSAERQQTVASEALSMATSKVTAEVAGRAARSLELTADEPSGAVPTASEVRVAVVVAATAAARAKAAAAALPEAEAQMTSLTREVERLRGLIDEHVVARASSLSLAASARAESRTAEAEVKSLLDSHSRSCPCRSGEREADTVADTVSCHRQTLADLRSLATGLQELVTHKANAHEAGLRLSEVLQENGFETMGQAKAAVLSATEVAELTTLLRAQEVQRAQATALLAQPDVIAALALPTPAVNALAEARGQAAASLTEAGRRHTLSEQAQRDLRALSATVHQALADLRPAEDEARVVRELADCVGGSSADNALRMRLSSYVLAARLAEIATLANERLGTMSDGRYTLEYTDARAAKGARSGLGLLVRDAWTGQPRETSSLSGGEAFMASLALALGLGDAVRAEAGGFDLQTLFVDEGFGTLDEDSLEQVMAVLDTLREGGRAVGIVSHVTELRQRIPQQLHVLKEQGGSTIRGTVHTGG